MNKKRTNEYGFNTSCVTFSLKFRYGRLYVELPIVDGLVNTSVIVNVPLFALKSLIR